MKLDNARLKSALQLFITRMANSTKQVLIQAKLLKSDRKLFEAVNQIVTPYSGFIISDYYYSNEIEYFKYSWLNPHSKRMTKRRASRLPKMSVVFCQTDMLHDFFRKYMVYVKRPIILISGKWQLPGLESRELAETVLSNENIFSWFSQNQIFEDLTIYPFPYGVHIDTAIDFSETANFIAHRVETPLIPFSTVHEHMAEEYRAIRVGLKIA